jgi:hypothetical protein
MTRALFSLLALLLLPGFAQASPLIWGGLFLGENRPSAFEPPPLLTHQLQQVFGFSNYRLLKGVNIDLRAPRDHWVYVHRDFSMRILPLPHGPDEPDIIAYEIYKNGFLVAKGRYVPAPGTPLFINGPDLHRGRLIFVIEAR